MADETQALDTPAPDGRAPDGLDGAPVPGTDQQIDCVVDLRVEVTGIGA